MKKIYFLIALSFLFACKKDSDSNDLTKEKWNGKIKTITTSTFFYDSTKAVPHLGEMINKSIREFNLNGNEISLTLVNEDDEVATIKKSSYNEKNLKTESKEMDKEGNLLYSMTYNYDNSNNLIEINTTEYNTNQQYKQVNAFDKMKNLIGTTAFKDNNEIDFRAENSYDEKNHLIEERFFLPDGTMDYQTKLSYDNKERLISYIGFANDSSKIWEIKNAYKILDKEGNWILQQIYKDGKPINVIQVQIEYYP